ncbi:hypothetical protein [Paenibacillus sp. FSL R5-0473]|uniref:hypothetical protein n=1 Tax=Paenibacillus sp. FSL R5-0473 TaxID=2921642 RepID=UPI0030F78024
MNRSNLLLALLCLVMLLAGCGSTNTTSETVAASTSKSSGATPLSTTDGTSSDVSFSPEELGSGGDNSGALVGEKTQEMLDKAEDDANLMNGFIIGQANNLFKIPGINSIQNLVFGNPYKTWGFGENEKDELVDGIFYQSEMDHVINPLIATFSGVYATILMLAIMMSSLKFGMKAHSPQSKEDFWKDIHMYVASAFFMGLFWMLFHTLMALNWGIVQGVGSTLKGLGKPLDGVSIIATATNDGAYSFKMGDLFVFLAEWGLSAYLNFIYIARKIIIVLLCVMSPFAAYSLLFAKTRSFFGTYIKELCGNIFLPAIHAIILFVFVQMAGNLGSGMGPMIFKLGMIIMFVPITGMVSKWLNLGDSSSSVGRAANAMGLGAIGGAMMLSKGVMNMSGKGRTTNTTGSTGGGTESPGGSEVSMGNDVGASTLSKAAAGGSAFNKIKKAGSITGGILGGTVGLPFGGAGVAAGAAVGSKLATGVLQGTRNSAKGLHGAYSTIRNAGQGQNPDGTSSGWKMSNVKEKWNDLAERRQLMGNLGESTGMLAGGIGAAIGMSVAGPLGGAIGGTLGNKFGTAGKSMGQMLSGVSRQRAFDSGSGMRADGTMSPRGMTLNSLSEDPRFSGSQARWNQTNDRSWYEAKDQSTGKWEKIGGYGAGDASLKTGQQRMVDYQMRNPKQDGQWNRQENGSYMRSIEHPSTVSPVNVRPRTERALVGMSGSTADLGRSSEAYIADSGGQKLYSDNTFDMRRLNPEDYFNHKQPGKAGGDDKVADMVGKIPQATRATGRNLMQGASRVAWAQSGAYNKGNRTSDIS